MNPKHIQHLFAALLLGNLACGSDPAPEKTGSSESAQSADDKEDDEENGKEDPKPARDAGTSKKDAGKPAKLDPDEETDDESVADLGPARVVDAGKKPATVVDAAHTDHVASGAADGGGPPPVVSEATMAAAKTFCGKYEMYCGYGKMNRHADEKACLADFEGNPIQQGCKIMHLDTSIAGTAAACNGMQSAFCFSIHCLHATGITDPTGVTYCK